jgi:hypothetical protein
MDLVSGLEVFIFLSLSLVTSAPSYWHKHDGPILKASSMLLRLLALLLVAVNSEAAPDPFGGGSSLQLRRATIIVTRPSLNASRTILSPSTDLEHRLCKPMRGARSYCRESKAPRSVHCAQWTYVRC